MRKKWPILLAIIGSLILLILASRYQPKETIKNRPADVSVEAESLFAEFLDDEAGANEKYLNKTVQVSGTVSTFKSDDRGNLTVTLRAGNRPGGVKCKLDKRVEHRRREFPIGAKLTLKGVCMGYVGDVEMVGCVEVE